MGAGGLSPGEVNGLLVGALRSGARRLELPEQAREIAILHGVGGMVLANGGDGAGAERGGILWSFRLAALLIRVLDVLEADGIRALALKGPVTSQLLYGDPTRRRPVDVDLLVAPAAIERAGAALERAGFAALVGSWAESDVGMNARWGNQWHYRAGEDEPPVELHWRLSAGGLGFEPDFEELWARREEVTLAGRAIPSLGREDLLLYACVHGAKHLWNRLVWVSDLAALVRVTPGLDWPEVMRRSRRLGCARRVAVGLEIAQRCLGSEFPAPVREWIVRDRVAVLVARALQRRLLAGRPRGWPPSIEQPLEILLLDGAGDRLRYLAYLRDRVTARTARRASTMPAGAT